MPTVHYKHTHTMSDTVDCLPRYDVREVIIHGLPDEHKRDNVVVNVKENNALLLQHQNDRVEKLIHLPT